jgi:transposase
MNALTISDAEKMIFALQDEIRRSNSSRYDHRLHGVLLVAHGMSCPDVGRLLGDAARTVENWVNRFEQRGFAGLVEQERSGRPSRLNQAQLEEIQRVLREVPAKAGVEAGLWDGKSLSAFLLQRFQIQLKVRQCQRLFRQLGFRFRKPRPLVAPGTPEARATHAERKAAHKKTPGPGRRPNH